LNILDKFLILGDLFAVIGITMLVITSELMGAFLLIACSFLMYFLFVLFLLKDYDVN